MRLPDNLLKNIYYFYVDCVQEDNGLDEDHPALAIFDNFKAQVTPKILECLAEHNIYVVNLPLIRMKVT